jgi:hypothetical protein
MPEPMDACLARVEREHHRSAMTMPPPYVASDDASLVAGCLGGDEEALASLLDRHGLLAELALMRGLEAVDDPCRALSERREALARALSTEGGAALLGYASGSCTLRSFLAVIARRIGREDPGAPRRPFAPAAPTPPMLDLVAVLDARSTIEHLGRVTELLDRQPPDVAALVRLRAHGVERAHAAALLGTADATGRTVLSRLASRLSEVDAGHEDAAAAGWRMVLDAASHAERVEIALLTERDGAGDVSSASLRSARARVEATFRALRDRLLAETTPSSPNCLDSRSIAGFVDGTMRGGARARVEGHVLACTLCLDEVAALALDTRAVEAIRHAASGDRSLGVAAALLASGRYVLAAKLRATDPAPRDARFDLVARIALAARALESGPTLRAHDASGVLMRGLPSDEEAPIVAFEALALDDSAGAYRALDETTARSSVGMRLRMLTAGASGELAVARALAAEAKASVDPGAVADAESLAALPDGASLPREILVERLRDAVPAVVRAALSTR